MSYGHANTIIHGRPRRRGRPPLRTALGYIRAAERRGRVPWDERLDVQQCELTA